MNPKTTPLPSAGSPAGAGGASSSQPGVEALVGRTLDNRYFVEAVLGEGGMGVVYRGRHKLIDKRVAIKVLRGDFAASSEMTERFLNEARAASSIGNAHIVDISDYGRTEEGAAYFVMEYLDGASLASQTENGKVVPVPRLIYIAKQIARGLAAAHEAGIVHRDLKPDNVMLIQRGEDRDFVKILDFGIAKINGEAGRLTRVGSIFGTPHYMSPEQAAGLPVDHRTDIYALGIILYEMASGKVPFHADNFMGILTQHMYRVPSPLRNVVPLPQEIPPGLEAIVLKCLSKKPDLRYQSMDELAADLEKAERGMVPNAVTEMMSRSGNFNVPADYFRQMNRASGSSTTPPPRRKNIVLWVAAIGVIGLGLVVAAAVFIAPSFIKLKHPIENAANAGTVNTAASASASGVVPPVEAPPPVAKKVAAKRVTIVPTPADATVTVDDKNLGTGEKTIEIPPSGTLTVRVERAGYTSRTVIVDGNNSTVAIQLDREVAAPVTRPGRPPPPRVNAANGTAPARSATPDAGAAPPVNKQTRASCPEEWDPFMETCTKHR